MTATSLHRLPATLVRFAKERGFDFDSPIVPSAVAVPEQTGLSPEDRRRRAEELVLTAAKLAESPEED